MLPSSESSASSAENVLYQHSVDDEMNGCFLVLRQCVTMRVSRYLYSYVVDWSRRSDVRSVVQYNSASRSIVCIALSATSVCSYWLGVCCVNCVVCKIRVKLERKAQRHCSVNRNSIVREYVNHRTGTISLLAICLTKRMFRSTAVFGLQTLNEGDQSCNIKHTQYKYQDITYVIRKEEFMMLIVPLRFKRSIAWENVTMKCVIILGAYQNPAVKCRNCKKRINRWLIKIFSS